MTKTISSAQEKALMSAMTDAIRDANAGMDANDAIVKHAAERGFNAEFACRMVEAYNTSRTIRHLNDTEGEKRAESFPIADAATVIKRLYTGADAKPEKAATVRATRLSASVLPDFNAQLSERAVLVEKAASDMFAEPRMTQDPMLDRARIVTKAEGTLKKIANARRELTFDVASAREKVAAEVQVLSDALREPGAPDLEQIDAALQYRHGELGKLAMDAVWASGPFAEFGEKRADTARPALLRKSRRADAAALGLMDAVEKLGEAKDELAEFEKTAEAAEGWLHEKLTALGHYKHATTPPADAIPQKPEPPETPRQHALSLLIPKPEKGERTIEEQRILQRAKAEDEGNKPVLYALDEFGKLEASREEQAQAAQKQEAETTNALTNVLLGAGGMPFVPQWGPQAIDDTPAEVEPVSDPVHERELRAARLQVLANDMIANDETLSAYPPEDVLNALNEVTRVAPALATNPLMMRSIVARVLQQRGSIDPAEVEQLLSAEKKQREVGAKGV